MQIILNSTLLVGDAAQIDYNRLQPLSNQMNSSMVSKQLGSLGNTSLVIGSDSPFLDCYDVGNISKEEPIKPLLLNTKFQRIKNSTTKLARVLVIDETPPPINRQTTAPATKDKTTRDTAAHTRMSSASSIDCD